jgi:transposase InsO family protein
MDRKTLAEIGYKLGKQALTEVVSIVKPDTILGWHRQLIAQKFDGSAQRKDPGRPTTDPELEALVVRMARENRSWGYDRIVGALANLGYTLSDQTVGNILKRHGLPLAPERKTTTTWKEFILTHIEDAGVERVALPPRSPNLNAYAERWVRSVKEECLSRLILFGEASLRHALMEYGTHYHHERNHQGKGNVLLFPSSSLGRAS